MSDHDRLVRLVYLSTAADSIDLARLNAILARARRNNVENRITGLLMFHEGRFMQILEGRAEDVERTFSRISANPLHSDIVRLQDDEIEERCFSQWTMGFVGVNALETEGKDSLIELSSLCEKMDAREMVQSDEVAALIETFLLTFREFDDAADSVAEAVDAYANRVTSRECGELLIL